MGNSDRVMFAVVGAFALVVGDQRFADGASIAAAIILDWPASWTTRLRGLARD